jgi:hypothetical protein
MRPIVLLAHDSAIFCHLAAAATVAGDGAAVRATVGIGLVHAIEVVLSVYKGILGGTDIAGVSRHEICLRGDLRVEVR